MRKLLIKVWCVLLLLLVEAEGHPSGVIGGKAAVPDDGTIGSIDTTMDGTVEISGSVNTTVAVKDLTPSGFNGVTEVYTEDTSKVMLLPAFEAGVCATGMAKVKKKCVPIEL